MDEQVALNVYVEKTLGVTLRIEHWPESAALPLYLREAYDFRKTVLLGLPCLLLLMRGGERKSTARIGKDVAQVGKRWTGGIIYVARSLSAVDRARFVEAKLPFIVPGKQLYLPPLGVDFREIFSLNKKPSDHLSPAAQALVLWYALRLESESKTPTELAQSFGYSKMTMGRAFGEIAAAGLAEERSSGKERRLAFLERGRGLWEAALGSLSSPVKRRVFVDARKIDVGAFLHAGETELSERTNLAPPSLPVFAIPARARGAEQLEKARVEYPDEAESPGELELWAYDPRIISGGDRVDDLSLYLSLREEPDERVQRALSEMLEGMKW